MVAWCDEPLTEEVINSGKTCYSGIIFTQRFLPRWVYRAVGFTMISVDTQCDGNKYLMVFDNSKEQNDEALKSLWKSRWDGL